MPPRLAASYRPDPAQPSQAAALAAVEAFAAALAGPPARRLRSLWRRDPPPPVPAGIYLDGGFGVGKPHLSPRCGSP